MSMTMATENLESSLGTTHSQMDELVETNRALHVAILELTGLLRNSAHLVCSRDHLQSASSAVLSHVPVPPIEQVDHGLNKNAVATISTAEVPLEAPLCRILLRGSFAEENEQANQRYIERRNAEMLRLKRWIDYKCKCCAFLQSSSKCSTALPRYIVPFEHIPGGA